MTDKPHQSFRLERLDRLGNVCHERIDILNVELTRKHHGNVSDRIRPVAGFQNAVRRRVQQMKGLRFGVEYNDLSSSLFDLQVLKRTKWIICVHRSILEIDRGAPSCEG